MTQHVIDTNVLIVASSADESSPFQPEATPVEEECLRKLVLTWLNEFHTSDKHSVLDVCWHIAGEYQNKLTDQDYGWLVIKDKIDWQQINWVQFGEDKDGHAVLPEEIAHLVPDLADRKMIAAILAVLTNDQSADVSLVNACDSDWLMNQDALQAHRIQILQLLPDWLRQKAVAKSD